MAGQRFDELRGIRRIAHRYPQPLHRAVQAVLEIDEGVRSPQALAQFLAGDHLARFFEESGKDLKRLLRQLGFDAVAVEFGRSQIKLARPEADGLVG